MIARRNMPHGGESGVNAKRNITDRQTDAHLTAYFPGQHG